MAKKIAKPAPKPAPKPAAKPAAKPAPKPAAKPSAKATPAPTPAPAPNPQSQLDLVRSPNFDAAMAQQDYANLMRDQQARIAAGRSGFSEGFRADGGQGFPSKFSRPSLESMINPEVLKKARDEYVEQNPEEVNRRVKADMTNSRYLGQIGRSMSGFDKWFETNYINNPNSALSEQERMTLRIPELKPQLGNTSMRAGMFGQRPPQGPQEGGGNQDIIDFRKRIYDDLMARQGQLYPPSGGMGGDFRAPIRNFDIDYIEGGQRNAPVNQGPQVGGGMGGQGNFRADVDQNQFIDPQSPEGQAMEKKRQMARDALSRYNPNVPSLMPIQTPGSDALNQDLANRGMGGGIPTPIPQGQQGAMASQYQNPQGQQQQMQSYQNFLNQGMNNMASINQGAAESFANTQPGMQVPQAGIGQTKGPNMPSIGTKQRRPNPVQRKFSTISNQPARFA